jgi:hypothetical protein
VLSLLELAEIELSLARQWIWWAKNAREPDARSAINGDKAAEEAIVRGRSSPQDCTAAAVGKAKKWPPWSDGPRQPNSP